jgi:hypothetical protein
MTLKPFAVILCLHVAVHHVTNINYRVDVVDPWAGWEWEWTVGGGGGG